jgi:hypothetical protein
LELVVWVLAAVVRSSFITFGFGAPVGSWRVLQCGDPEGGGPAEEVRG